MEQRDGWKRDGDGWYGDVPAEFPVTEADRAAWAREAVEHDGEDASDESADDAAAANPYRKLPARVALEDTVGEVDTSPPPFDPARDPNREVATRWGAGLVGGV